MKTSTLAYIEFKETDKKEIHHKAILSALLLLGCASSPEIAQYAGIGRDQSFRRMNELVRMGKVYVVSASKTRFSRTPINIYALIND